MKEKVRFLGLDVHAETIAVAVAETDGEVRSLGVIANRADSISPAAQFRQPWCLPDAYNQSAYQV